jgi:hypothetical protein
MSTPTAQQFCCDTMTEAITHECTTHPTRSECPDCLIQHYPSSGDFGILIHDGGASYFAIQFCPWCGHQLSPTLSAV